MGTPELLVTLQRTSASASECNFLPQSYTFTAQEISLTLYSSSHHYLTGSSSAYHF